MLEGIGGRFASSVNRCSTGAAFASERQHASSERIIEESLIISRLNEDCDKSWLGRLDLGFVRVEPNLKFRCICGVGKIMCNNLLLVNEKV
jgi:hypothetical protein